MTWFDIKRPIHRFCHFEKYHLRSSSIREEVFTFGKHKGAKVEKVLETEPGYFSWIQNADFPLYTKKVLTAIKLRKLNTK
jgi:hypothetical protein